MGAPTHSPHPRTDAIITQIIADGGELTPAHRALVDYTRRLESALNSLEEIREIYAGMEGFVPQTAPEAYQDRIIRQMYRCAIDGIEAQSATPDTQ